MRRYQLFVLSFVMPFLYCSKSTSSTDSQVPYIRIYDVTQTRDSVNTTMRFRVSVTPQTNKQVKVDYATEAATAQAGTDFTAKTGTLTIDANQPEAFIDIQVIGRQLKQSAQLFYVKLSNAAGAQLENDRATATLQNPGKLQMVWSDEFNGTSLTTTDWNYETGGGGWGNNELENYTSGTNNAYLENGNLVIEAKKENLGAENYTSARLTTKGKRKFTYAKVEIRAKLPVAKGIWPALWMLGENINTVSWPSCGEIDMMEEIGEVQPSKVYGTAHWGTSSATHLSSGGSYSLPAGSFADSFHVFTLDWTADKMQWSVDGTKYYEVTRQQVTGGNYPFDKDFFIILNLAVGGSWPGNPTSATTFPQKMYVDYVRVYQM